MEQNRDQPRGLSPRGRRLTLTLTDALERIIAGRTKITEIEDLFAMELAARLDGAIAGSLVIDNPVQMQRLLAQLQAALPIPACATPELAEMLKAQNISNAASTATITAASYAGDEGGIMCRLEIPASENAVHVSITHLCSDPRLPITCEITAYQKHRVKHLKPQMS